MRTDHRLLSVLSAVLAAAVVGAAAPASVTASPLRCAHTAGLAPSAPAPGQPCWTDVTPYPFGSDGNPVDPSSTFCTAGGAYGPANYGPNWLGDFSPTGYGIPGEPACYEQVTSVAFRAWNRGLAATKVVGGGVNAFGVWLYNGTAWFPDPSFPGSGVCRGSTVLWAGKLDYWLIGSPSTSLQTLCRFDGTNLVWEALTLPAATLAHLPVTTVGTRQGGITSGTCFAWDNCWFFGNDGIQVHWDGQQLTDEGGTLGASPWLQGDVTAAASVVASNGAEVGLAANSGQSAVLGSPGTVPLPADPSGAPAPRLAASTGGNWTPTGYQPSGDPAGTSIVAVGLDASSDAWLAGGSESPSPGSAPAPAPLTRIRPDGSVYPCPDYGATAFTDQAGLGYRWTSLAVAPDAGVLAGGAYTAPAPQYAAEDGSATDVEPIIAQGACGSPAVTTEFRIPDPFSADPSTAPLVPADEGPAAAATAVAAPATNDAWAATSAGVWRTPLNQNNQEFGGLQRPHLYLFTDGQVPAAPAGDDNEIRPSLFSLSPPVYDVSSPVVVAPTVVRRVKKRGRPRTIRLAPAVYDVRTRLVSEPGGRFVLRLTFRLRRPVTIGLAALHGRRVVARTSLRRFSGRTGVLSVPITRRNWPTGLKLLQPTTTRAQRP